MDQRVRRLLPVVAVIAALLLLGWVSWSVKLSPEATPIPVFEPFHDDTEASASAETISEAPMSPGPDREPRPLPSWIGGTVITIVTILLASVGVLLLLLLARYLRDKRPTNWDAVEQPVARRVSAEELRDAVRAGLSDIDAGGDPRAAVIACWLRLERAAADADVARLAADTPADLAQRLLERHHVDDDALTRLAEAYRRARYSPRQVTAEDRDDARAALAAVDVGLAARIEATS